MSRPALPEERGADLQPDPPTLDELRRTTTGAPRSAPRGQYLVNVCEQCGHERAAGRAGRPPDCEVREVPSRLVALAKRHGLLPETSGARIDSMAGLPGDSEGSV